MIAPDDDAFEAVLVLAAGGRIARATPEAAAMFGLAPDELTGRAVSLTEKDPLRSERAATVFDLLADLSSLALFSQDSDGRIVSWNRGAERIFGYPAPEMVGELLASLVPPHLRPHVVSIEARVRAGERVDREVTEFRRKDGMPIPVALSAAPVHDSGGVVSGAVGVVQELTETRLAQAALAEVEKRLAEWETLAHVGRWLWDVGTDAVQWSDELHRMHGIDPLRFEGTLEAHLEVMHAEDRARVLATMWSAVRTGEPFEDEFRSIGADGTTRLFALRAEAALGSSGEVVGLRGVSHDLTVSAARRSV